MKKLEEEYTLDDWHHAIVKVFSVGCGVGFALGFVACILLIISGVI